MNEVMQHKSDSKSGVSLTESAINHILSQLAKENCLGIRFSVKKTGCSGLSYVIDYVKTATDNDFVQKLGDEYQLFIDKASYPVLKGMHIDFVKQGLNSKFVFTNPNQTGQCGCGESFTINE